MLTSTGPYTLIGLAIMLLSLPITGVLSRRMMMTTMQKLRIADDRTKVWALVWAVHMCGGCMDAGAAYLPDSVTRVAVFAGALGLCSHTGFT
jgi:hypothetical protein